MIQGIQNAANQAVQGLQEGFKQVQGAIQQFTVASLAPELAPLQSATTIILEPTGYIPCCSCTKLPQYFYKILLGDAVIAHIMHGMQAGSISCCDGLCGQCGSLCGKGCKDDMMKCLRLTKECCAVTCQCLFFCKCLSYCCGNCGSFITSVQQFDDYENVIEVKHYQTSLGWGASEKDGLYVGKKEFAIGAFHETQPLPAVDWLEMERKRSRAAVANNASQSAKMGQMGVKNAPAIGTGVLDIASALEQIDNQELPGVPKINDLATNQVDYVMACLTCTPYEKYRIQTAGQAALTDSYPITYQGKYIGRYIYGYQHKPILNTCCPCLSFPGYSRIDDVYLLDQFDNLIFRAQQKPLGCFRACQDQSKGLHYNVAILDPKGKQVGNLTKTQESKCMGCKKKWQFMLTFPEGCKPLDKVLLTYLFPFLNEKYMNIFNSGDSHLIEHIEHDKHFPEMKKGKDKLIVDRLTDKMSFDDVSMTSIPGLLTTIIAANPSREQAQAIRIATYADSPALVKEFARKKRIVLKRIMLEKLMEQQLTA